jgi:hypothetical protein
MHGRGLYSWPNGEEYEGEYVMNKKQGYGSYRWKNGKRYIGEWLNNLRHGKGCIKYEDGTERECLWDRDAKVGLDRDAMTESKRPAEEGNFMRSV